MNDSFKHIQRYISTFLTQYHQYLTETKNSKLKIVDVSYDQSGKVKIFTIPRNVKSQIPITYYPEEIYSDDELISSFSSIDARTITFLALINNRKSILLTGKYKIIRQEYFEGKSLFVYIDQNDEGEKRKTAQEIYQDLEELKGFDFNDLVKIISASVQEQTIEDLGTDD